MFILRIFVFHKIFLLIKNNFMVWAFVLYSASLCPSLVPMVWTQVAVLSSEIIQ